jgi:hypothetical protein
MFKLMFDCVKLVHPIQGTENELVSSVYCLLLAGSFLAYSSILKMEAARPSETFVIFFFSE